MCASAVPLPALALALLLLLLLLLLSRGLCVVPHAAEHG